jgi:hypothetical protein
MNKENAPSSCSSCFTYLLILLGIIFTVGAAFLLSQFDTLQQRNLLPQATIPVVDFEATLEAGDLPVIVITGEASQSEFPTANPIIAPTEAIQTTIDETPETPSQTVVPTCSDIPNGWLPYQVKENDSLRSLAIQLKVDEDTLALANCLIQPQLTHGDIIYLPRSPETMTEGNQSPKSNKPEY